MPADLVKLLAAFPIEGRCVALDALRRGHIHDTFVSTWEAGGETVQYLHQRINRHVFRDVDGLMHNVQRITRHLARAGARNAVDAELAGLTTLELIPTADGRPYLDAGDAWRTFRFVAGTDTFDRPRDAAMARAAALAFGDFLQRLSDLPPGELVETIPDYFRSPHRLAQLDDALRLDPLGRSAEVGEELAFVEQRKSLVPVFELALARGEIPARVVHGDTKLNNVLFDTASGRPRCIVDLDTAMAGYALYDFGDLVRFTAATAPEDEPDPERMDLDLELYAALADGFLTGAGPMLSPLERSLLPTAARLVTLTIGMRFLTDHLLGDPYFRTSHPGHNLTRARAQFALVRALERRLP